MSLEVITIIMAAVIVFVALGGSFLAGFVLMRRHMDKCFNSIDANFHKLDEHLVKVHENSREVSALIRGLHTELYELKDVATGRERLQQGDILPRLPCRSTSSFLTYNRRRAQWTECATLRHR